MQLSIKTALIDVEAIPTNAKAPLVDQKDYTDVVPPDPNILYVSFKIPKKAKLSLHLYNKAGKKLKPIFKCKSFDFGKHIEKFDIPSLKLEKGSYKYQLRKGKTVLKERTFEVQ